MKKVMIYTIIAVVIVIVLASWLLLMPSSPNNSSSSNLNGSLAVRPVVLNSTSSSDWCVPKAFIRDIKVSGNNLSGYVQVVKTTDIAGKSYCEVNFNGVYYVSMDTKEFFKLAKDGTTLVAAF